MLESSEPVAFLPSHDLDRSEQFFTGVLGLALASRSPFASDFTMRGARLRVIRVEDLQPQPFTVHGWVVADIRAEIREMGGKGTTMLHYEGVEQDDDGIWTTPGGDLVAWFHDPDSNVLSLTQLAAR